MSKLEKFLKESNLSDDAKKVIQEAWDAEKLALATEMRNEMKQRFGEDMQKVVESFSNLVDVAIKDEMKPVYEEKAKLINDRKAIRESLGKASGFINKILAEEVKGIRAERKHIQESVAKVSDFTNLVLSKELKEFHEEKNALRESRVKIIAEADAKFKTAKEAYKKRITESVATYVNETLNESMQELRQDIMEAKQNHFGKKLFEAFENVYKDKHFRQDPVAKELKSQITLRESKILELKKQLNESITREQQASKKVNVLESNQMRNEIMNELCKPLTKTQRYIMESILEKTPTKMLKENFNKYHKAVLNETDKGGNKQQLNESVESIYSYVNGDRLITESEKDKETSDNDTAFINDLKKMAGISSKK